jgi:hypothetical protein
MYTRKINQFMLMLSLATVIAITGCKKDKDEVPDTDTESSIDNSFAEVTYDDVKSMADQAGDAGALSTFRGGETASGILSSCAVITNNTTSNPKVLTIDFGSVDTCLCKDGRYRKGKIIVQYQGAYRDSGSTHNISFDNYYVNSYKVAGTKTVTNQGLNSSAQLVYSVTVNGIIINPSGNQMTWNSQRTRTWIAGQSTALNLLDDEYDIGGSASGTSFAGTQFTMNITSPLRIDFGCFISIPKTALITQGKFDFTPSGKAVRSFDFGSGSCDNDATVTINENTYNIKLR